MFEISSKKVDFKKWNLLIKKSINLDSNLDCFVLISTDDANFWNLVLNNLLDFIINKISKDNAYNDFSVALENLNALIKTWKLDSDKKIKADIIIWILNENSYIFSNIWKSSCYLINKKNEVIELTNNEENKKEFSYVSSWDLSNNEIIVSSSKRLLNYLSKSDLIDWIVLSEDINIFNKNIKNILLSELLEENVLVSSLKYTSTNEEIELNKIDLVKEHFIKLLDNKFSKNILWYLLITKDKVNASSKLIKNWVFLGWITIWILFLYSILSTVIWISTQNEEKEIAKQNILLARDYIKVASENIANTDIFELNIKNAENLISKIKEKQLFLNDISKVSDNINILKKQFNKIEIFDENPENIIYTESFKNPVKIVKNNLKPYVITNKGIIWPILSNSKPKNNIFNSLEENENFVDAAFIWDNMYLLTSLSKVVKFTKNWYFSYMDVSWQKTWQKAKEISSYAQNIYLVWKEDNQIYKHSLSGNSFKSWNWYLKNDDLTQIWEILSVTIDGAFYILKKDLSIIKFYSSPYRIENIVMKNLPKNYNIEEWNSIIDLKTRADLDYIYLLLNNKIWIFQPNTTNYKNTKSLKYLWQIEWSKNQIKDFYINHNNELVLLNENGLYKVTFEINEDRLLIR